MVKLDHFTPDQKRQYVVATIVIGLLLSTLTLVLRIWARIVIIKRLRLEDWFMIAGVILSYGAVALTLWGLSTGLAEPLQTLSADRQRGFLLGVWITQKIQPPTIFCIKVSIILFNAHIFQTRIFRRMSWAVGALTFVWMVGTVLGTTFQCSPATFFFDKKQPGSCMTNTLLTIGLTSSILSFVGDIIILVMPIPSLSRLKVDKKTKMGLLAVFTLGLFVVITSFMRWLTLAGTPQDGFDSGSVQVGVWTYLEMSIGITCGNLPFLAPFFGCVGPRRGKSSVYFRNRHLQKQQQQQTPTSSQLGLQRMSTLQQQLQKRDSMMRFQAKSLPSPPLRPPLSLRRSSAKTSSDGGFYTRFYDSGSEVELQPAKRSSSFNSDNGGGGGGPTYPQVRLSEVPEEMLMGGGPSPAASIVASPEKVVFRDSQMSPLGGRRPSLAGNNGDGYNRDVEAASSQSWTQRTGTTPYI
ncbi:hypothetical protein B0H63DRAFT_63849 [Podospora didyma]|uniref:Rhodopsin domain-containing protein n=1 Tax=Podospora didyma TaxID=330526 RepID=A0AAE0P809_9PEZI|nr:hypothetical protein B0H63DRAFT_63849 [Podospora didyma]